MNFGVFFFGTVDMPDAGVNGPPAHKRRYTQIDYRRVYDDLFAYAKEADRLGFDSMWTAEHHFHHHGFEVVPNVILLNAVLAQHTQRIKFGSLVHVLTAWHPVRFAEDYALADVLSGGRMLCGLGRGTEQRESNPFGVNMGWNNDPDDVHNREVFEEQVAIFKAATSNEEFSFRGKQYVLPPDGLQFRNEPVTSLPLVPRPLNLPVTIYQAVTSEETLQYAAREGHIGVFWQLPRARLLESWRRYGDLLVQHRQGRTLRGGEDRMLVVNLHMAATHDEAMERARPGHDELRKLLWPNLVNRNPALATRPPFSLEETVEQGSWLVGSVAEVRDELLRLTDELGLEYLTIFPHLPGLTRSNTTEQLRLFQAEVMPALQAARARVAVTS
jgi:alkanesulfonate monooxygenase SsuD/methylene tetrahydromethanopterin reductase-like flavin-dependent oxidoreductase (luciferase family)